MNNESTPNRGQTVEANPGTPAGDTRPSITDLQRYDSRNRVPRHYLGDLRRAAPALLEIAAALLAYEEASCDRESAETDDYIEAANRGECAGDTHDSRCPVAIAHGALIRTAAKVRR